MPRALTVTSHEYANYLTSVPSWRKLVRSFYLQDIASSCVGKTIDLGCGSGSLLPYLPKGSIGLEINLHLVKYCVLLGLSVFPYNPKHDLYKFSQIKPGSFQTLTANHVLEHLDNPHQVLRALFSSCHRLRISRLVFTVPGSKGFLHDPTHRQFIDLNYLLKNNLILNKHYHLSLYKSFPFNYTPLSRMITHNETRFVYNHV